jgi:hypothetical protein
MRFILIIILALTYLDGLATAQYPDYLIYKGDTIPILNNPLETFLKANNITTIPGIVGCNSTACWRGYKAFWIIQNDSLYLIRITSCCESKPEYDGNLKKLFGDRYVNGKVFASWENEKLISPQGRLIQYVHMGYGSIFERELHLTIADGQLKKTELITNQFSEPDKIDRFNYELIQDTLFYYISTRLDWKKVGGEMICDSGYLITINKNGKVTKVKYEPMIDDSKWKAFWWNFRMSDCRRTIKRPIKELNFARMIVHGRLKPQTIKLELSYSNDGELSLEK